MAYPSGTPVKTQVLDQLAAQLGAIAAPSYHYDVRRATVFGGQEIALGRSLPAIVIVPTSDEVEKYIMCQQIQNVMAVDVMCAVRISTQKDGWRDDVVWLLADVRKAITADIQLGATAVYADIVDEDLPDKIDDSIAVGRLGLRIAYRHNFDDPNT